MNSMGSSWENSTIQLGLKGLYNITLREFRYVSDGPYIICKVCNLNDANMVYKLKTVLKSRTSLISTGIFNLLSKPKLFGFSVQSNLQTLETSFSM